MIFILINSISKGGAEIQLRYFCDVLEKNKYDYKIIFFEKSTVSIDFKNSIHCKKKSHISRILFLYKTLKKDSKNSYLLSFLNRSIYYATFLNILLNFKKSIAFYRNFEGKSSNLGHIKNFFSIRTFSHIYSNSIENQEYMSEKYLFPKKKSLFIPNAIDISTRKSLKNKNYNDKNDLVKILVISRNTRVKNLVFLFEIIKYLPKNFVVEILGKGFQNSEFKKQSNENFGDRIIFTDFVRFPAEKIFSSSLLLSVSHFEGTNNAILESLTLGLPVVSSPTGTKYLIKMNFSGLHVIDGWNPKTYADEIMKIAKEKYCWVNDFSLNNQKFENEVLKIVK